MLAKLGRRTQCKKGKTSSKLIKDVTTIINPIKIELLTEESMTQIGNTYTQ